MESYDKIQLIPNIGGTYHLLVFNRNTPLSLYRFDRELQYLGATELPVAFSDTSDMRIIAFKNFYFLYLHKQGSTTHQLWKINAAGEATSLSAPFQRFIDTNFERHTSTLNLVNRQGQLAVMANIYYEELKAVTKTIVTVDSSLVPVSSNTVSFPFEQGVNALHQEMLIGGNIFILKSTRHTKNYILELIKADLETGKVFRKPFQGRENFTRNAVFRYNPADSSILIQSSIGTEVFITKLDLSLNELVPSTVLTPRFSKEVFTNFLLLDEDVQQWIVMDLMGARLFSRSTRSASVVYSPSPGARRAANSGWGGSDYIEYNAQLYLNTVTGFGSREYPYRGGSTYAPPVDNVTTGLRLLVADKEFRLLQDSVVTNKKSLSTVSATEYANVTLGAKSYLVLKQDFPRKRKGLLLVSVDHHKQLLADDIAVFGKYEYLLQYAQAISDGSLVLPYVQGSELGLVKLSFANMEQE